MARESNKNVSNKEECYFLAKRDAVEKKVNSFAMGYVQLIDFFVCMCVVLV